MVRIEKALIVVLVLGTGVFQQALSFADDAKSEVTPIRVVVQDCRPEYLETSDDGHIIVGRGAEYGSWHKFHVVDVKLQKTLLSLNLPQKIIDIAIAPDNTWFVVAGQRTIYRIEISTGKYEVLLDNVSGHVVLNAAGDRQSGHCGHQRWPSSRRMVCRQLPRGPQHARRTAASFYRV